MKLLLKSHLAWLFPCKFAAYFQNSFFQEHLLVAASGIYKYLLENKILYSKQLSFPFGHSTHHASIQFVDKIFEAFENNLYTLGLFIDPSKNFQKLTV